MSFWCSFDFCWPYCEDHAIYWIVKTADLSYNQTHNFFFFLLYTDSIIVNPTLGPPIVDPNPGGPLDPNPGPLDPNPNPLVPMSRNLIVGDDTGYPCGNQQQCKCLVNDLPPPGCNGTPCQANGKVGICLGSIKSHRKTDWKLKKIVFRFFKNINFFMSEPLAIVESFLAILITFDLSQYSGVRSKSYTST